jgi:hypothetical protein
MSSGYAGIPNSGTSSPSSSISDDTRMDRTALTSLKTTKVAPNAHAAQSVAPRELGDELARVAVQHARHALPGGAEVARRADAVPPGAVGPVGEDADGHRAKPTAVAVHPQGSSTLITRSLKSTPQQTTIPARMPIRTAALAPTNAHGAVIATRPASMPLQAIEMSGFPNRKYQTVMAVAAPATAARLVRMVQTLLVTSAR